MTEKSYEIQVVEENAIAHIQAMIIRLLDAKQISRTQLAESMDVSAAHISQLLGDNPKNLSVRKAARLFQALGEELIMTTETIERLNRQAEKRNAKRALDTKPALWGKCANSNAFESTPSPCELLAA